MSFYASPPSDANLIAVLKGFCEGCGRPMYRDKNRPKKRGRPRRFCRGCRP